MNEARVRALALLLALAPTTLACQRAGVEAPLAGAKLGGPFSLIDQNGRRVTDRAFAGRYRLVYFGYTFCPDVCPTSLQHIAQGMKQFEASSPPRAAKVQPIFITVDPERDTPAVLREYVHAFHPRLIGLTGSPAEIAGVAREYGVIYGKRQVEGASGYLMDHMSQAILYGPAGEPIALLPQEKGGAEVAEVLEQWVR